jgi:DUF917 family protein
MRPVDRACISTWYDNTTNATKNIDSPTRLETVLRTTAIELGLGCALSAYPLPGAAIKSHGIPNTFSLAWYLGRAIHMARSLKRSYVDAIVSCHRI